MVKQQRLDTPRNSLMDVYGQLPVVRCWVIAGQAAVYLFMMLID